LEPFFAKPLEEIEANADPLQNARLELMAIFAANSLHWMYLCTRGESPTEHPILDELTRIKKYMDRLKELDDKSKAPKLDKRAVKNFIRSALWEPKDAQEMGLNQEGEDIDGAQKSRDLVEQQLDEVLKRYKAASTHKWWSQDVEEVAEVTAVSTSAIAETSVKESKKKTSSKHKRWSSDAEEIVEETVESTSIIKNTSVKGSKIKAGSKRKRRSSEAEEVTEETVESEAVTTEVRVKKPKNKKRQE